MRERERERERGREGEEELVGCGGGWDLSWSVLLLWVVSCRVLMGVCSISLYVLVPGDSLPVYEGGCGIVYDAAASSRSGSIADVGAG